MRILVALLRLIAAAGVVAAVAATCATARRPIDPFNLFGFFTIQSNLLVAAALAVAAAGLLRRRGTVPLLRGITTVYAVLTGVVYNLLLRDVAGGVAVPWANVVLHVVVPACAALDWLLVADRPPLRWSRLALVVPYPLVWTAVVLVRGATDGWVPYPFLDPRLGYGAVGAAVLAIAAAIVVLGALVWLASRLRVLQVRRPLP